jgi:hypothetical protein
MDYTWYDAVAWFGALLLVVFVFWLYLKMNESVNG